MNKKSYLNSIDLTNLGKRVVCFLTENNQVLLGQRKEGMGLGLYVGIGGKLEEHETEEDAIIREVKEEINVELITFKKQGSLSFVFPHKAKWNQTIVPFVAHTWNGNPIETDEILPKWFKHSQLPASEMWDDNPMWISLILQGKYVSGVFVYNEDNKVEEYKLQIS